MIRFLIIAFALALLVTGVFAFTLDTLGLTPTTSEVTFGFGDGQLPVRTVLAVWSLEALGLMALYLMVQGRWGSWWQDGLAAGWIAWVFRGPLLVLTVAGASSLNPQPWWEMALRWFLLYSLLGLVVAISGRHLASEEEEGEEDKTARADTPSIETTTTDTHPRPNRVAGFAIAAPSAEGAASEEAPMLEPTAATGPEVYAQVTDHPPIQEPPREAPAVDDPAPHDPPEEAPGWKEPPEDLPGSPGDAPVEDPPAPHRDPHPDEIEPPPPPPPPADPDLPGPAPEPTPPPVGDPPREI